jgi:hypothetical protein
VHNTTLTASKTATALFRVLSQRLPTVRSMGQPALLYLVPCTLGLLSFVSYADGTLRELWRGPPSLEEGAIAAKRGEGGSRGDAPGSSDRSTLLYNL